MNKIRIQKYFTVVCLMFVLLSISLSSITATVVSANHLSSSPNNKTQTADKIPHSNLFQQKISENPQAKANTFKEGDIYVSQLLSNDDSLLASEAYNPITNEYVTTSSTPTHAIIEKTKDGVTTQEIYSKENLNDFSQDILPVYGYGNWTYTGIAVPRGAIDNLSNLGAAAMISGVAGLFGVTVAVINQIIAFMGIGWSVGEMFGRALDANGNGWVGLYKRAIYAYPGGPLIGYQHKTL